MSSSNAPSPRQDLQLLPKDFIKHHRSNFFQYEEKLSPEPNQSTSPEWITLKVRIVGKPSTFERMNPWSNRPYISWVEDVSSRHWLQVWLGRCIRWSWQICLIPPWILWIWFRNGNEMAVIGHQKARCRGKTKRCWCCKQEPGSWLVVVSFNFFESLLYFDPDILRRSSDLTSLFLNWVQLHIQFSKAFPKEAYWGRTPRFQITEF